jgi:homospermidine synthase
LFQSVEYKPLQVEMISEDDLQQQNIDDKDTILDIKERYLGNRRMHMVYFIPLTNRKFNYLKSIGICAPI